VSRIPERKNEESRFRAIFRDAHADHSGCREDEWLMRACHLADGTPAPRPIVWSRRNGPWRRLEMLIVGAAPGNAGGMGTGLQGAHGTRIPFGGDIAGANLDVLLGSAGLDRNGVFIVAALNQLPARGGGEPTLEEMAAPVGRYPSSFALLRQTVFATGPRLVVALGNVGLRALVAAVVDLPGEVRLPSPRVLERHGLRRGDVAAWPPSAASGTDTFTGEWRSLYGEDPLPRILWLTHPSAQNMSPHAGVGTVFHSRMLEARDALRGAVASVLDRPLPSARPPNPETGIYALPEWRERIAPRHASLDRLWREKGV